MTTDQQTNDAAERPDEDARAQAEGQQPAVVPEESAVESDTAGQAESAPVEEASDQAPAEAEAQPEPEPEVNPNFNWYALRVQTGREMGVKDSVDRRVKMEGLEDHFGRIVVPTKQVSEIRDGKKRVTNRKTYAGYIFIEMEMTDEAQHLVNETPGVAGFVGVDRRTRTKPVPMRPSEVEKILNQVQTTAEEEPKVDIKFNVGDSVKVKEGPFENFDGVVEEVNPTKGTVKVVVTIFGRPTPYELEHWQIESN